MTKLKILKFGGTSVGRAASLARLFEIVGQAARTHRVIVVSSAAAGVTDLLCKACHDLEAGSLDSRALLSELRVRHLALAADVLPPDALREYSTRLERLLDELSDLVTSEVDLPISPRFRDAVVASGERLSMPLVYLGLETAGIPSSCVDATELIRTDGRHGSARVLQSPTERLIRSWYRGVGAGVVPVVTGFLGATSSGNVTTLGRGGSDYTGALLARSLGAVALERWTDVDGIYTDDPRTHPSAKRLHAMALDEAWAWNRAGRIGMHRKALDPLLEAGIRLHVRSTEAPENPGTVLIPRPVTRRRMAAG
jgi:aspartate kinase